MENLYESVVDLLGKPIDHPDVYKLVKNLHDQPLCVASTFSFIRSGFTLYAIKGIIRAVMFSLKNSKAVPHGGFKGQLFGDIKLGDTKQMVQEKFALLEMRPMSIDQEKALAKNDEIVFDIGNHFFCVSFDGKRLARAIFATTERNLGELEKFAENQVFAKKRRNPRRKKPF